MGRGCPRIAPGTMTTFPRILPTSRSAPPVNPAPPWIVSATNAPRGGAEGERHGRSMVRARGRGGVARVLGDRPRPRDLLVQVALRAPRSRVRDSAPRPREIRGLRGVHGICAL